MTQLERSLPEILEEAGVILDGVEAGLKEVSEGLERQRDELVSQRDELDVAIANLHEREHVPLRGTVEFLSLGRLTIGQI
ncbi:MAG TPA: hypothetical protein VLE51_01665 [Candidatus Saccharimonadales bacterium]|nr:hypothetical protein [Candidatus Saccharimonadales bacterium]